MRRASSRNLSADRKNLPRGLPQHAREPNNLLRGPAHVERMRACVEPENTLRQLRELRRLAPALARLHVIRVWSGIEGYIADSRPVLGASARVPGLYYAFGFCGEGFQLGPGVGDVMAELIATGATSTPIEAFHIGRFARPVLQRVA